MNKTYLAYGSNLNLEQMGHRCPAAAVIGTAVLEDHRLVFKGDQENGVATIERQLGASVPVLLWEITAKCERMLDRYEGFPRLYRKELLSVVLDGDEVEAMAYIMNEGYQSALPDTWYFRTILDGYRDCGFDEGILRKAVNATARECGG